MLGLDDEGVQDLYDLTEYIDIDQDLSPYSDDIQRIYKIMCIMDLDHIENLDHVIYNEMEQRCLFLEEDEEDTTSVWSRFKMWLMSN